MRGPEANFYQTITRKFPDWLFQRIETLTSQGVPDVHVCTDLGYEFWLELKATMTKEGKTFLRMEQYAWGMRRARLLGQVWVWSKYTDHVKMWAYPFNAAPARKGHVSIESSPTFSFPMKEFNQNTRSIIRGGDTHGPN